MVEKTNTGEENTGRWTPEEHALFLKGLEIYGKGWKNISLLVKTRSVVQIRTHAQKYFLKLQKGNSTVPKAPATSPKRAIKKQLPVSSSQTNSGIPAVLKSFQSHLSSTTTAPLTHHASSSSVPHSVPSSDDKLYEYLFSSIMSSTEPELRTEVHPTAAPSVSKISTDIGTMEWENFEWMEHRHISPPSDRDVLDSSDDSECGFESSDSCSRRRESPLGKIQGDMHMLDIDRGNCPLVLDTYGDNGAISDTLDHSFCYDTRSAPLHHNPFDSFVNSYYEAFP